MPAVKILLLFSLTACAVAPTPVRTPAAVEVETAFLSASTAQDQLDSISVWLGPADQHWLIATAKGSHRLRVYDARDGRSLHAVGGHGSAAGEFDRPNGIAVAADLLLVVERDNARVQVMALPEFESLGWFGDEVLGSPYGLWVMALDESRFRVFVTDSYMDIGIVVPAAARLDRRVREWSLARTAHGFEARLVHTFGPTRAPGALRVVESIWGDPDHNRLLIAEEDTSRSGTELGLKAFTLDGEFLGRIAGVDQFVGQPEGIALWQCADGSGYWLASDQSHNNQRFLVFDRRDLYFVGAFHSAQVFNTDGVWLQQTPLPGFPAGAFFVVHDDQAVAAFDWRAIAAALSLPERCDP